MKYSEGNKQQRRYLLTYFDTSKLQEMRNDTFSLVLNKKKYGVPNRFRVSSAIR